MADTGTINAIVNYLSAAAGLGAASMGVVDCMKVFHGGPSNIGFKSIESGLAKLLNPAANLAFGKTEILASLKSNWINGVPKAEQKAKAKSLIHLCLTKGYAKSLADAAGVSDSLLGSLATNIAKGTKATQEEINVLGQFDAVLSALLDNVYERADQEYRNGTKALAMLVSILMSVIAGALIYTGASTRPYLSSVDFGIALLVGISATPLAPMAKDLSTALQAAVAATRAVRR